MSSDALEQKPMPNSAASYLQDRVDICVAISPNDEALARDILARVVDKWSLWVLSELAQSGPLRFARLLERVEGIRQKSLTTTLRQLERDGFVTRTVTAQVPIRVDYDATALGRALIQRVHPLWFWAVENLNAFVAARASYDERQTLEK